MKELSKSTKDITETNKSTIKNFNRLFNSILIVLSVSIFCFLKIMDLFFTDDVNNNKYKFLVKAIKLSKVSVILNLSTFIAIQLFNKVLYEPIAIMNKILFSIFFQMVAGILRSYLFITSDPLIIVTSVEIIARYLIQTHKYTSYRIMSYSSVIILIYSWTSMILYHTTIPSPIIYYNTIITLVFGMLTIYSKAVENNHIIENELKMTRENERNYYINILDNLNVGFVISEGSDVSLSNKYVLNIMEIYNKSKELFYEEDPLIRNNYNYNKEEVANKDGENNSDINKKNKYDFLKFLYEEEDQDDHEEVFMKENKNDVNLNCNLFK